MFTKKQSCLRKVNICLNMPAQWVTPDFSFTKSQEYTQHWLLLLWLMELTILPSSSLPCAAEHELWTRCHCPLPPLSANRELPVQRSSCEPLSRTPPCLHTPIPHTSRTQGPTSACSSQASTGPGNAKDSSEEELQSALHLPLILTATPIFYKKATLRDFSQVGSYLMVGKDNSLMVSH